MTISETAQSWAPPKSVPANVTPEQLDAWRQTTAQLRQTALADGLSRSEVARRSEVPIGTLSPWYDGSYTGTVPAITERVRRWLDHHEEAKAARLTMPAGPDFVETPTARKLIEALLYAQTMPEFTAATLGAGVGKTSAARHFCATRPNAYLVTMRPTTSGTHAMLQELAIALDVTERNPARLDRSIGHKLKRNGRHTLLIIDEAQNLSDQAVNQLRHFLDVYGCGIALLGNEEVSARFGKRDPAKGEAQIHRRIGIRITQMQSKPDDVEALLDAWEISDKEVRRLCHAIARKPGALGQVDKSLKLGSMLAMGGGRPLSADDIRQAWANRSGEDLR